ncbi:hypothetical protein HOP50_13g70060 [Chloropicon primus]|uniref:BZIP domain-containing protein n=1 Tax=Chloropicon primus TaxID=1764295 RepID=A0A5B8MVN0_9CHLO|nr:hypothetical protein A3770_13p69850 [Chloropicon primus]UPR03676.1 hypothetical protein HOP50_13g70060 [Chloropicon primus]|mmetsp:Transcript_2040/g.5555  ORF Transcript_2040/g.5555 Transcript_2040/m.5555 type:complete len:213 (-) Transcript_2040:1978-2616(-)|eukprot:QDZ24467.1 hypothetical protein A3770_13p69850 [Chloropicon primus]
MKSSSKEIQRMNQSAVREDFIPPVDVDMSQGGVHAFCSEGMQIAQLPITPCFGSPSGMPVPSGVTKPSSNGLASGQDSGMVVRRFPSCDGDGLECSHEHEEYVEGGVKITKCTHTHVHSARQANQKAVQKYRQKKKLELENLKKENLQLKGRVAELEQAMEKKLEGEDLLICLRREDKEQLEAMRALLKSIHIMTAPLDEKSEKKEASSSKP